MDVGKIMPTNDAAGTFNNEVRQRLLNEVSRNLPTDVVGRVGDLGRLSGASPQEVVRTIGGMFPGVGGQIETVLGRLPTGNMGSIQTQAVQRLLGGIPGGSVSSAYTGKLLQSVLPPGVLSLLGLSRSAGVAGIVPGVASTNSSSVKSFIFKVMNERTNTTTEFYFTPDTFSDNVNASFSPQSIMGRSAPIQGYSETTARDISFSVQIHDDYTRPKAGMIKETINNLRALVYPKYENCVKAPLCYLQVGDMIKGQAICTSVGVTWNKPMRNNVYVQADVALSFQLLTGIPPSTEEVEQGIYGR